MYNVCLLPRKSKFQNLDLLKSLLLAWQLLLLRIWPEQDWALQWYEAVGDFRAHPPPHHSWGRPGPDPDLCFSCSSSFLSCKTQAKLLPPLIFLADRVAYISSTNVFSPSLNRSEPRQSTLGKAFWGSANQHPPRKGELPAPS